MRTSDSAHPRRARRRYERPVYHLVAELLEPPAEHALVPVPVIQGGGGGDDADSPPATPRAADAARARLRSPDDHGTARPLAEQRDTEHLRARPPATHARCARRMDAVLARA